MLCCIRIESAHIRFCPLCFIFKEMMHEHGKDLFIKLIKTEERVKNGDKR